MNVGELKAKLANLPDDMEVMIDSSDESHHVTRAEPARVFGVDDGVYGFFHITIWNAKQRQEYDAENADAIKTRETVFVISVEPYAVAV